MVCAAGWLARLARYSHASRHVGTQVSVPIAQCTLRGAYIAETEMGMSYVQ
jgi:hypothetical protein